MLPKLVFYGLFILGMLLVLGGIVVITTGADDLNILLMMLGFGMLWAGYSLTKPR